MAPEPEAGDASRGRPAATHKVVVNHEEQFSLLPATKPLPTGWRDTGVSGTDDECLSHIARMWDDMRPKSVRDGGDQPRTDG